MRLLPVFLFLGATLCIASPARAAWPNAPTVNVPVCTSEGDQWNPVVAPDGSGGAVVAWYDWRGGNADVYAQKYNSAGVPQWTAGGVLVCGATGDQTNVRVVNAGSDGTYLVWQDGRTTASGIFAQRLSSTGVALWTADGILVADRGASVPQASPSVASDYSASLLVAWVQGSGTSADIYAQNVTRTGTRGYGASGLAVCAAATAQGAPAVVNDGTQGGGIYAWQDARNGNLDIYAQRANRNGVIAWTANGVAVCSTTGDQQEPALVYDAASGAVVSWTDLRSGSRDVYGQRINGSGVKQWPALGVAVIATTGDQWNGGLLPDGDSGGVFYSFDWRNGDADVYAQRVNSTGSAVWTANGVLVCSAATDQASTVVATDGNGGGIVTWRDDRNVTSTDIYAQHLTRFGDLDWTANGVRICTAPSGQTAPAIAADASGGAFIAWMDQRGSDRDIYAQHVDTWGYLGAQPRLVSVRDVSLDQGGNVLVRWNSSPLDSFPDYAISEYWVYRRNPGQTTWSVITAEPAQGLSNYSRVTETLQDSTGGSNLYSSFKVEARGTVSGRFWASDVDSGYSVDNLAPPAPGAFTAQRAGDVITLHWAPSSAPDLAEYRLYRGTEPGFVPGPGNFVVARTDTGYAGPDAGATVYKLSAVDAHGNEGPYASLTIDGTTGVTGGSLPPELALSAPAPNPLRGSCTMRLALPREAHVSLAVFDQQGRRMRTLLAGALSAGEHPIAWDGRDDSGRPVASALYFVRLESGGRAISRRLVVVR
jgi:hypothetical protein